MSTVRSGSHQVLCFDDYKDLHGETCCGIVNKSTQLNREQAEKVKADYEKKYDKVEIREL